MKLPPSKRQQEVLECLCRGMSQIEICEQLGMSVGTEKTHIKNLFTKCGVGTRLKLVVFAFKNGLVSAGPNARTD